jgi:membrane protease subunit HflC
MRRLFSLAIVLVAIAIVAVMTSEYRLPGNYSLSPVIITKETEHNVLTFLNDLYKTIEEPGIEWMIPGSRVITLDRRLQHLSAKPVDVVIALNEKLKTSYYALWRIVDPEAFIVNFPLVMSDAELGMKKAQDRIQEAVNALVGARIAGLELSQLLGRSEVLDRLAEETNAELADAGVEIVDVRISRTELPENSLAATYAQMREQRRALAREYRVRGERAAREQRAAAEREARGTRAEARAFSEVTRGEGDAEAARVYSDAYSQDAEFYAFVRSLEAYRKTLGTRTTMVLPPSHRFFRFLDANAGGSR